MSRSRLIRSLRSALPAFYSTILVGCISTTISDLPPNPDISRLLRANRHPLSIVVRDLSEASNRRRVGFQYVFGVIPFGSIRISDPDHIVCDAAVSSVALRGFNASCNDSSPQPLQLSIEIVELTLDGYDFFFFRRPYAYIRVRATLRRENSGVVGYAENDTVVSDYSRFAFEDDLSRVMHQAANECIEKTIPQLGL